ncbi:hypothetical protein [Thalassobacillus devorans]|uniref:hypothetical protein n=1 Tax=Thalassobacillus devorans TaxID=279813 RepID=UPI00048E8CFF|nr:hypothetical protein [Thalassobacillus devorans]
MKKWSFLVLTMTALLLLSACSGSDTQEKEAGKNNNEDIQQEDTSEKTNEGKKQYPQPYQALQPSEDAKPLKKKLSKKERKNMPEAQADGADNPERSVPAGQMLVKGARDQTDGPLKNNRLVAFYGHPNSENMGILGEMEPEAMMKKLKKQTQAYSDADPERPAIPTIELITTVAQRDPGPNGKYYRMTPKEDIEKYAKLAEKHNALLLLDIQLGTDSVMNQVKLIEKWLKLPYVHLAIDTEFSVEEGEIPGEDLGQVDGQEVQKAVKYLSRIVEENNLPDKIVLVHQFTDGVLTNKDAIQPTDNVEVALNFDGWGASRDKQILYRKFVLNDTSQYGGFKTFYNKDKPVLKPMDVVKLDPAPAVINYQ